MNNKCVISEWYELEVVEKILKEAAEDLTKPFIIQDKILQKANTKNHNGRIYPREVLFREVSKYEKLVKERRALGELDHPDCNISNEFDVLTKSGWKKFDDLVLGEEVYTITKENKIELNEIQYITNRQYSGKAYKLSGRGIDSSFTPTHRLLLEDRYGNREYVNVLEIYENRPKYNKHKILKSGFMWEGLLPDTISIPGVPEEEYNNKFKNDVRETLEIDTMTFVRFLGMWLAEGHVSIDGGKSSVVITQKPGPTSDLIRDVLSNLPIEFSEYEDCYGTLRFCLRDLRLAKYLSPLGKCHEKYIPHDIKQLDAIYLEELIEWFILGDGRIQEHEHGVRKNLFSTSKKLVEDIHECLIKTGGSGNWTEVITTKDYMFSDRLIEAKNKRPLYQLNISTTKGIYLDERFLKIEEIYHDGYIYCITVKNGNFFMKENGKAFLTGNSPIVELKNVSHLVTDIYVRDDEVRGTLEVLNTPAGRILRDVIQQGVKIGISSRGIGSLQQEAGNNIVQDDFELIAFDAVSSPSTPGAYLVEGIQKEIDRFNNLRMILHGINKDSYFK